MTWTRCHTSTHLAFEFGVDRTPITPFSFEVSGVKELLFETDSETAKPQWFRAGWLNIILLDASLPTFRALQDWEVLPLGEALFTLPSGGIFQIRVCPVYYLDDLMLKVWKR